MIYALSLFDYTFTKNHSVKHTCSSWPWVLDSQTISQTLSFVSQSFYNCQAICHSQSHRQSHTLSFVSISFYNCQAICHSQSHRKILNFQAICHSLTERIVLELSGNLSLTKSHSLREFFKFQAIRLESSREGEYRYIALVSTMGRQDTEESVILGLDCTTSDSSQNSSTSLTVPSSATTPTSPTPHVGAGAYGGIASATIGLVLPIWMGMKVRLSGDGYVQLISISLWDNSLIKMGTFN